MNYVVAGIYYNLYPDKYEDIFGKNNFNIFNISLESYGEENPNYEEICFWIFVHIN